MTQGRNPLNKAASLHRSQISGDLRTMQAVAAEFSGYAGKFRCFLRGEFKCSLFRFNLF
jgi:hypothetical protein